MQITVSIPGVRAGEDVQVELSQEGDTLTVTVPAIHRKPAVSVEVNVPELQQAQATLAAASSAPSHPPVPPVDPNPEQ